MRYTVTVDEDRISVREWTFTVEADDPDEAMDVANLWPTMSKAQRRQNKIKRISVSAWAEDEDSGHWDVAEAEVKEEQI